MVSVNLEADYFWTRGTVWVEDGILAILNSSVRDKNPPIGLTADAVSGKVDLAALFDRLMALRHVKPRDIYFSIDNATHERTLFASEDRTDGYYRERERDGHFGGVTARFRHGTKGIFPTLYGRPDSANRTVPPTLLTARGVTDRGSYVEPL